MFIMRNRGGDYIKKLIAKRRLKNGCDWCGKPILKGYVYYRKREVFADDIGVYGHTTILCHRCKYKIEQHKLRYEKFQEVCKHPEEFVNTVWGYIPGEAVKEPWYCECRLCGNIL